MNQFTASLWGDEAFSAFLSTKSIPEIISIISRDTSPPLYNLTEHLAFRLFGTSEIVIRGLSFFYFLIAIFFVYKIGVHFWNKKTALIGAALTFLNPFFFTYAFEGRMYSILAATVTASMYFFIKRGWVGYVLTTTAALYSHHFAIFAVFIQGLWFIHQLAIRNWKLVIPMLKAFLAIALLYSPWLLPLYNQTKMVGGGFWLGTPTLKDFFGIIGKYLGAGIPHLFSKTAVGLALFLLILRKWGKDKEKSVFLLSWFLGPIILVWLVSQKFQSIFFDRYLLYTIPAGMLLVSSNLRKISYFFLVSLTVVLLIIGSFYFNHPTKRPFKELAAYVSEEKRGDDFLINWNSAAHHLWESKYYLIPAPIYIPKEGELPYYVGTALMTKDDIIRKLPEKISRLGVITSGNIAEINLPGYTKGEDRVFGSLKFVWFTPTPKVGGKK